MSRRRSFAQPPQKEKAGIHWSGVPGPLKESRCSTGQSVILISGQEVSHNEENLGLAGASGGHGSLGILHLHAILLDLEIESLLADTQRVRRFGAAVIVMFQGALDMQSLDFLEWHSSFRQECWHKCGRPFRQDLVRAVEIHGKIGVFNGVS